MKAGHGKTKGALRHQGTVSVLYAANDGLYLIRVLRNGAEDADAAVSTERGGWQKGRIFLPPYFLPDGRTAGYLRQDGFYGCSIETGKEELLLNGALSFVPDGKEGFYASSEETGIVRVHMGQEQEEVWKPKEPVEGGWIQCEKLTLSPDGKNWHLPGAGTLDRRKDPGLSLFEQNQGNLDDPDESEEGRRNSSVPRTTDNR